MQIKAPFIFDCEQGVALKVMHGTQSSSLGEGKVSYIFSSCDCNLGYILELRRGWPFTTRVCSATTGLLCNYEGNLRKLQEAWQCIMDASQGMAGD